MTDTYDIQHTRDQIVEAALPHIPFDGWTMTALNRAAADLGLNEDAAALAFPVSATDAIEHHSGLADRKMVEASGDLSDLPIRVKVATVIRTRLEQNMPHREAIRRACATLAMPAHAPMAARCLYRTVDAVWYAAGDTATDWNFYSKRALLAGVYSSTLFYWLEDASDLDESFEFLDRRIENVMQIPKLTGRLKTLADNFPKPAWFFRA